MPHKVGQEKEVPFSHSVTERAPNFRYLFLETAHFPRPLGWRPGEWQAEHII